MPREFPAAFDARLHALFPDYVGGRFNESLGRWELIFLSAAGYPVSQFWGLEKNPLTGERIKPDPATGLLPFRDLDIAAQDEIVANCRATFIGVEAGTTSGDAHRDWSNKFAAVRAYNKGLVAREKHAKANDLADMISSFDIRRPGWLSDHSPMHQRLRARQEVRRGL
jgi:hypothetical protein